MTATDTPPIVHPADPTPAAPESPAMPVDALATLTAELERTRETLSTIRREREIHKALFEAGAHDLDIGAAMIERDSGASPDKPIIDLVGELKKRKPALFARANAPAPATSPTRPSAGAMGARTTAEDPKRTAAERAATTGDRSSLMTYLRLRRQPV